MTYKTPSRHGAFRCGTYRVAELEVAAVSADTWAAMFCADVDLVVDDLGVWLEEQQSAQCRAGDIAMGAVCALALAAYEMRGATSFDECASASIELDAAIESIRDARRGR